MRPINFKIVRNKSYSDKLNQIMKETLIMMQDDKVMNKMMGRKFMREQ